MNTKVSPQKKDFSYLFLVFYIFWGFIFTKTVFANNVLVYFSFLFLFGAFALKVFKFGVKTDKLVWLCVPYLLITALGYLVIGDMEHMSYWFVAAFVIMTGASSRIVERVKFRLLYFFGLFAFSGILIQFFLPSFYHSNIAPLFINDFSDFWEESYGFAGFTYQLAATAEILICAECTVLFLWDDVGISKKKWVKWMIVIALIVAVFMTGKRMNSIMAVVLPFFVNFLSNKSLRSRYIWIVFFVIVVVFFVNYISHNQSDLSESVVFRRSVSSFETADDAKVLTSGRNLMWARAMDLFSQRPLFGIGVDRYRVESGFGTDVHNVYIQCLCEQGIVGLFLFLLMIVPCFVETIKMARKIIDPRRKRLVTFSLAIQSSYLLEGITENMNVNLDGFLLYSVAIAIMLDCRYREKIERIGNVAVSV